MDNDRLDCPGSEKNMFLSADSMKVISGRFARKNYEEHPVVIGGGGFAGTLMAHQLLKMGLPVVFAGVGN